MNIRFELVREGRIELDSSKLDIEGVPVLANVDAYAEKLLANADRGQDRSTMSRDIIDLAMMIDAWGSVPSESVAKAEAVYGSSVARSWDNSRALISNTDYLMRFWRAWKGRGARAFSRIPGYWGLMRTHAHVRIMYIM